MIKVLINELFYSIQGEGIDIGLPTFFIRMTGCPLRCRWCDQPEAFEEGEEMTIKEILERVKETPAEYVCVTGGEPLAQKESIPLIQRLLDEGFIVSVETGGALSIENLPCSENLMINLDIKCPSSGMEERMDLSNIELLGPSDQLKFVIQNDEDYAYAKKVLKEHKPKCSVIMQPEGGRDLKNLAEKILSDGLKIRVLPQLHKLIWGNMKGV